MSDAPQGPGWWLASDGKYYPPQSSVPPPPPVGPPPRAPRSRAWLWVLLGVFVVLGGCTVLGVVVLVSVGDEIQDNRSEALDQVECEPSGVDLAGHVKVMVAADNTTSKRSDFWVEFELVTVDDFLGDGFAAVSNVPAGVRHEEEVFTNVPAPGRSIDGLDCRVLSVNRFASR